MAFDSLSSYDVVEQKRKYLGEIGGISKLTPASERERIELKKIISQFRELESFEILNDNNVEIIIRYKKDDPRIDVGNEIRTLKNAYLQRDYRLCIKKGLLVLRTATAPKSDLYGMIGLSYYGLNMTEKAEDYLRVACCLTNEKNYNKLSLEEMVERVEDKMKQMYKNNNGRKEYNFFNSKKGVHIDGLSVPNLEKVLEYIEQNLVDLETAGRELGLTNEEIDFLKLIFAREFYKSGDIEKGDAYLQAVEQTSGKTNDVTRLCLEARTNKLFFQYRDDNKPRKMALVKPGKRKLNSSKK